MFVAAIGTHDRKSMHSDHFGDSEFFALYEIRQEGYRLLEYRRNTSPEERTHGDPNKAGSIMKIVKGCDVLVGRAMGPNFVRIRDNSPYLPIIVRNRETVEEAAETLVGSYGIGTKLSNTSHTENIVKHADSEENHLSSILSSLPYPPSESPFIR